MKEFRFNHNDYVNVTLSEAGAKHLTASRTEFYDKYPRLERGRCQYGEGEAYKAQFWSLISDFHGLLHLGMQSPFEGGVITVESSLENKGVNYAGF